MARKGSQQKVGSDRNSENHKKGAPEQKHQNVKGKKKVTQANVVSAEEMRNINEPTEITSDNMDESLNSIPINNTSRDCVGNIDTAESSNSREENGTPISSHNSPKFSKTSVGKSRNEADAENLIGNLEFSNTVSIKRLRASALSLAKTATEFLEKNKPFFDTVTKNVSNAACYIREKCQKAYPIILRRLVQLGEIMLLVTVVWLDSALRGLDSFLHMGTSAFLSIIWCTVLSVIAMIGIFKFSLALVILALVGLFIGFAISVILLVICGIVILWFCGSFWTTGLVICSGGIAFVSRHEKFALLIITLYSTYCAKAYVGWLGLLLALNLSFISSDALTFLVRNNMNNERNQGQQSDADPSSSQERTFSFSANERSSDIPSTSGNDSEMTSEDEVVRLLNCTDHYSALGMSRNGDVDVSILKREYRKKAMLVHPDKNMGNEKAVEAFKKLQNAYEVLLDSVKRKDYDEELRREELLNFFRGIQNTSQANGRHNIFGSGFSRTDSEWEDPFGESRRIACRKCGNFHIWIHTKKMKLTARWCQDCNDLHPAKDGDGWLEQSSQPLLFGMLQKVDAPRAYVCADSRIYDATEWYICQGMRCQANTHKPSFHVNTSLTKNTNNNNNGKGSSGGSTSAQKGPFNPPEESMTEEQFFEWVQNAVQNGMFDSFANNNSSESPSYRSPSNNSSNNFSSGSNNNKRKKKGKKQR